MAGSFLPRRSRALTTQSQFRTYLLVAATLLTFIILSRSFHVGPTELQHTTGHITSSYGTPPFQKSTATVKKVTALFGPENELYEAALETHILHNQHHGYELRVLRERIVNSFWSKPAFLLAQVIDELTKPKEQRVEWLMWIGSDFMILNPEIPLEIFLPPKEFSHKHFIGTRDDAGFNGGAFFIRVHEWSVKLLIEVLAIPKAEPGLDLGYEKDQTALERVLRQGIFSESVTFQPRTWFNAYQTGTNEFEGVPGSLLVHFHDMAGDKWSAMSRTLDELAVPGNDWRVPLHETNYLGEIDDYWARLRRVEELLERGEKRRDVQDIADATDRLRFARDFETDRERDMIEAMDKLRRLLNTIR